MTSEQIRESRDSFSENELNHALKLCKDTTRDQVTQLISDGIEAALQKLDKRRQGLAGDEKIEVQRAIRELQDKESLVTSEYVETFYALFDGSEDSQKTLVGEASWGVGGLALLDTQVLEQQIIVERMSSAASAETQEQFSHLNRRFCFLKDARIKPADSPLGPVVQGKLLITALSKLEVSTSVRIIILGAFEKRFAEALGTLYADVNGKLVDMGILPQIKHHIWRTDDTLRSGRGQSCAGMTDSQKAAMADKYRATNSEDLGEILRALLGGNAGTEEHEADVVGQSYKENTEALLEMMDSVADEEGQSATLLQRLDQSADEGDLSRPQGATREVLTLSEALCADFIKPFLRNPASRQAWRARKLAIPVTKLAIIDPSLLMEDKHPARQVLKAIKSYADILEIADELVYNAYLSEFETVISKFEDAMVEGDTAMQKLLRQMAARLEQNKFEVQANLSGLHAFFESNVEQGIRRNSGRAQIFATLSSANLSEPVLEFVAGPWFDLQAQQYASAEDGASGLDALARQALDFAQRIESAGGDLSSLQAEIDAFIAAGLLAYAGQLQKFAGVAVADGSPLRGFQYRYPQAQKAGEGSELAAQAAWLGKKIKPGMWLSKPKAEVGARHRPLFRFYRSYASGETCLFVDGLGLRSDEMSATTVGQLLSDHTIQRA